MPKNRTAEKNKFAAENYDRINLMVRKGRKDAIKAAADARGISVNAYINMALNTLLKLDGFAEDPEE